MHTLAFWKNWPKADQFFLAVLAILFTSTVCVCWYSYHQSPAPAIVWEHYQEIQAEEITQRTIPVGLLELPVRVDNFFVFETQQGSALQVTPSLEYAYLAVLTFGIIILLAIITTLKRLWFLAGMTMFSVLTVSLSIETLEIAGLTNKYPAFVFLFVCIAWCYALHTQVQLTFYKRLALMLPLFIVAGFLVEMYSQAARPFLHLAARSYFVSMLITMVFILMIGHEIPAAFVNLITRGTRQTKSLRHFTIISGVYILNLLLTYAKEIGYLSWNIWLLNASLLLTFSAILGVWGFLQRSHQYQNIIGSNSIASFLMLMLGSISFATLAIQFASANENATEVLLDVILYSHLGYGIIFLFYVIANFGPMLMQNLQVYKVLYKPNTMHFVTFRIMGLITCFAFLVFDTSYNTVVDQLYAAYYNRIGDVYYHQGADQVAESYYQKSLLFRNQNHHAHYALASIEENRLELRKKKAELTAICYSSPSEQAFINLSVTLQDTNEPYEALFLLNEAKKKFPESGVIHNTLGLAFTRLKVADSALLSFQEARKDKKFRSAAETNLLAASAKFKLNYPADSLLKLLGAQQAGAQANALALANMQQIKIRNNFITSTDTIWTPTRVTYLCNYLINQPTALDTTTIKQIIEVARKPVNEYYKEAVIVAAAQALYAQGKIKAAFDLTREMAFASARGRYYALLGYWALEQNNPQTAASYFEIAKEKNVPNALLYQALALTEADSLSLALPLWDSLALTSERTDSLMARLMQKVLTDGKDQPALVNDQEKYWYARYRIPLADSSRFFLTVNSIQNTEIQTRAILDAAKKWYNQDELEVAASYLNKIEPGTSQRLNTELIIYQLLLMAKLDAEAFGQQKIEFIDRLQQDYPNETVLLQTWQAARNHQTDIVTNNFTHLSTANVYFEDGLIQAAHYFEQDTTDRLRPYSILVSGLIAKPNSIKLLKAHTRYSAIIGFDEEANESLEKLRKLITPRSFNRFISENPDIFSVQD
ncbi:MAG: hypothetical protein KF856_09850 [Cyclobacteriaceae bacterium]|nr:hypothetical protein [Cyclobacteriaceae bacterium]